MKNKDRVEGITREALKPNLSDAQRLEELYDLEGAGTPVASALLTVWNPKDFAIIDRLVWRLCTGRKWISGPRSCDDTPPYLTFLEFIRAQRNELGGEWTAREVEEALYALAEGLE